MSPRAPVSLTAFVKPESLSFSFSVPEKKYGFGVPTLQPTTNLASAHMQETAAAAQPRLERVSKGSRTAFQLSQSYPGSQNTRFYTSGGLQASSHSTPASSKKPMATLNANSQASSPASVRDSTGGLVHGSMRGNLHSRRENVSPVVAQMLYEDMLLGRYVEDACARLYYHGKTAGFVHLYTGQEAVSTGVLKLLRKDDAVASTYRDHVHATSKGVPAREVFAELFGRQTGCSRGFGGSMHMFSKEWGLFGGFAFIGEQIPVALGVAFSQMYRRLVQTELPGAKDQVGATMQPLTCTFVHTL